MNKAASKTELEASIRVSLENGQEQKVLMREIYKRGKRFVACRIDKGQGRGCVSNQEGEGRCCTFDRYDTGRNMVYRIEKGVSKRLESIEKDRSGSHIR
ncbi:MAG: hypothetical protein ACK5MF_06620 [Vibrio sp.]|uniref:hypothetical protein n=1 Tax=Vibrio sp. TaxID=678 RepID=UPI003A844A2C